MNNRMVDGSKYVAIFFSLQWEKYFSPKTTYPSYPILPPRGRGLTNNSDFLLSILFFFICLRVFFIPVNTTHTCVTCTKSNTSFHLLDYNIFFFENLVYTKSRTRYAMIQLVF